MRGFIMPRSSLAFVEYVDEAVSEPAATLVCIRKCASGDDGPNAVQRAADAAAHERDGASANARRGGSVATSGAPVQSQLIDCVPRLRRYARSLLRNRELADDLVQDTLERALRQIDRFQKGSDLRAWLFTIMHNVFANQMRRADLKAVHVSIEEEGAPCEASDSACAPLERLELRDLDHALQSLPADQRHAVLLVGLEQLSYTEAAVALDIPIGTLMSRLWRGRERLRELTMRIPPSPATRAAR
jgi:RNA polymerase sigma-70 factor (ECF subfamily)